MTEFWVGAGLIGVAVLAILLLPALRAYRAGAGRAEYDVNVYKDQLKELEREAAEGRIRESELEAAKTEIQRRLLAAADEAEKGADMGAEKPAVKGSSLPLFIAAGAAPVLAIFVYLQLGAPGVPGFPMAERTDLRTASDAAGTRPRGGGQPGSMTEMIASLEEKLRQNPDNVDGWILLARSYISAGKMREAAAAYERAVPLADRHPALLADWAEARLMARDGEFTPDIFNDFLEARERDPLQPKPWFYIGLDKAMGGDFRGAAQYWTDLLTFAPKDASYRAAVEAQIARAAQDGDFDPATIQPSPIANELARKMAEIESAAPTPPAAAAQPGPTREDVEAAQQMSTEDRQAFIRSMVQRLADRLAENPEDRAGWERLINAYEVLGETEKAAEARKKLEALGGG